MCSRLAAISNFGKTFHAYHCDDLLPEALFKKAFQYRQSNHYTSFVLPRLLLISLHAVIEVLSS